MIQIFRNTEHNNKIGIWPRLDFPDHMPSQITVPFVARCRPQSSGASSSDPKTSLKRSADDLQFGVWGRTGAEAQTPRQPIARDLYQDPESSDRPSLRCFRWSAAGTIISVRVPIKAPKQPRGTGRLPFLGFLAFLLCPLRQALNNAGKTLSKSAAPGLVSRESEMRRSMVRRGCGAHHPSRRSFWFCS